MPLSDSPCGILHVTNAVRKRTKKKVNCFSLGKFSRCHGSNAPERLAAPYQREAREVGTRIPGLFLFALGTLAVWPRPKGLVRSTSGPVPKACAPSHC